MDTQSCAVRASLRSFARTRRKVQNGKAKGGSSPSSFRLKPSHLSHVYITGPDPVVPLMAKKSVTEATSAFSEASTSTATKPLAPNCQTDVTPRSFDVGTGPHDAAPTSFALDTGPTDSRPVARYATFLRTRGTMTHSWTAARPREPNANRRPTDFQRPTVARPSPYLFLASELVTPNAT